MQASALLVLDNGLTFSPKETQGGPSKPAPPRDPRDELKGMVGIRNVIIREGSSAAQRKYNIRRYDAACRRSFAGSSSLYFIVPLDFTRALLRKLPITSTSAYTGARFQPAQIWCHRESWSNSLTHP
ncbi:hypothetical protein ABZX51_005109 [Aspergillus tubingensis]